ncbi:hypothetical protein [Xanthovirga aplysinae]|uniref:hypothetical protein n=1 Tax=Xanthovirga aplysinae TaxID=2529853 RepID=UPI0012BD4420|nr:hypothetical protein [Xanthovirga aplysinae]MTI30458.1 hypothetical protein [Xanthovirga aplysinae]
MMKNLILLASLICLLACNSNTQKKELLSHVGDIVFDPKIDTAAFEPCHKDLAFQYYNFSDAIQYKGEKAKIRREFESKFRPTNKNENGYVTIRFIVNCEGKTGWFRTITMDKDYKHQLFSAELTSQLLEITKQLDGWQPKEFDGKRYDYYQYLTFKITKGNIEDIMP